MTAQPRLSTPLDVSLIDRARIPRHVAIIMDGNGRWAQERGLSRTEGHRRGVEAVRRAVRHAGELGIRYLTLFSFSSENWARPKSEVNDLLGLLKLFVRQDLAKLDRENVRVVIAGERAGLSRDLQAILGEAETLTRTNTGLTLVVAFNYGGRDEIVRATRQIAEQAARGELDPASIDETLFESRLDTVGMPDPDMIVRTSGEQRLSNFLLWQAAYAEFVFLPEYWPDFDERLFDRAIAEYQRRDRRFGGVAEGAAR